MCGASQKSSAIILWRVTGQIGSCLSKYNTTRYWFKVLIWIFYRQKKEKAPILPKKKPKLNHNYDISSTGLPYKNVWFNCIIFVKNVLINLFKIEIYFCFNKPCKGCNQIVTNAFCIFFLSISRAFYIFCRKKIIVSKYYVKVWQMKRLWCVVFVFHNIYINLKNDSLNLVYV